MSIPVLSRRSFSCTTRRLRRQALQGGGIACAYEVGPRYVDQLGLTHMGRQEAIPTGREAANSVAPAAMIGGIRTSRMTRTELAAAMLADVLRARAGGLPVPKVVVSSNGLVISSYHRDRAFRALVDQADIVDVDGMPLVFATKLFWRRSLSQRVATTDFIRDAAAAAAAAGVRFYFLGGKPGVGEIAARNLQRAFPALEIVGIRDGYFAEGEEADICREIVASGADVLWLGLGSPKQERFAIRHRERLAGLAWIKTCGGLFDHVSASVPRAPGWMQAAGLEWLYRAILEPRRLGLRYLRTNPQAVYHLLTKTRD